MHCEADVHTAPLLGSADVPVEPVLVCICRLFIFIALPVKYPIKEDNTPELLAAGFAAHLHTQFPFGQSVCAVHEDGLFCPELVIVCISSCCITAC